MACRAGHDECVRALLAGGADARARDVLGATPLHAAAEGNAVHVGRILIDAALQDACGESPVPLLADEDHDGWSAQQVADFHNHDEFVEMCICAGLDKTRLRSEVRRGTA